jgi:hypothetical protein
MIKDLVHFIVLYPISIQYTLSMGDGFQDPLDTKIHICSSTLYKMIYLHITHTHPPIL